MHDDGVDESNKQCGVDKVRDHSASLGHGAGHDCRAGGLEGEEDE